MRIYARTENDMGYDITALSSAVRMSQVVMDDWIDMSLIDWSKIGTK